MALTLHAQNRIRQRIPEAQTYMKDIDESLYEYLQDGYSNFIDNYCKANRGKIVRFHKNGVSVYLLINSGVAVTAYTRKDAKHEKDSAKRKKRDRSAAWYDENKHKPRP